MGGVAAALGGAGAANASCASLNGQSIGAGCTTGTGGFSLALGPAAATAAGPGNIAIAVGNPGFNRFYGTNVPTQALADGGTGNVAVALGDGSNAGSRGNHNTAFVLGQGSNAFAYGGNNGNIPQPGNHNTSITVANGGEAGAVGKHKLSTAFSSGRHLNNGLGG